MVYIQFMKVMGMEDRHDFEKWNESKETKYACYSYHIYCHNG